MFAVTLLTLAAASFSGVSAHGGVLEYSWGGKWYFGWAPYNSPVGQTTIQRPWATYNPIQDATATTIACNDDGTSGALQLTATVAAGTAVTAYWNQVWPHNTGPVLTYLANCGGSTCTGVNANTLKWFKIEEAGLISGSVGSGLWAAGQMIAQNSSWTTTIPKTVPSGNYLLRFETIALHSLPAQFYPECAQVTITGGGTLQPTAAQLCSLPGCYSNTDPGVNLDIYSQTANSTFTYVIPGPPLYGSTATSSTTPPKSSTTAPSNTPTTTPKPTTSTPAPTSSAPSGGTVAHYGQCGGQGWTGATACAAPYTCVASNPYYSQCL